MNELFLYLGCSNCECDEGGALSSCQVPQCKPNHDLLIEETSCDARGLKCCRMTCDGPGTMCLPDNAPNADLGQKSCKEGYKCVTAPSRLKRRLLISWCASGGFSKEKSSEFSPFFACKYRELPFTANEPWAYTSSKGVYKVYKRRGLRYRGWGGGAYNRNKIAHRNIL